MKKRLIALALVSVLALLALTPACALTLKRGSTGTAVARVQRALVDQGYADLRVDGKYGETTEIAVIRFQQQNGLKADGKAGPRTLNKLLGTSNIDNNPSMDGKLRMGCTGSEVAQVQQLLKNLNYPVGRVDGIFGKKTYAAVRSFQSLNGIPVSGVVGDTTLETLKSSDAIAYYVPHTYTTLKRGDYGALVKKLQNALNAAGFNAGTPTGYFNEQTEEAVINFQRANGLVDDDIAGQKTQEALYGKSV